VNAAAASKSNALPSRRLLRDREARDPQHDALEGCGDGAGVGDVVAEVGAVVDPRDDEVGLKAVDQAEGREAHAVHRRPIGRVADAAVAEGHLLHPQRAPGGDRARRRRAVGVGRDDRQLDVGDLEQRTPQRLQPVGLDPVVVGQQHAQHGSEDRGAHGADPA
jgi:hypothetical protein